MSIWERNIGIPEATGLVAELRANGITDEKVLASIERVPRPIFVPSTFQAHAWDNLALPIGHGQTISQPQVVAIMTQALELHDRCTVLEIGTGSGYQTAVLAPLCRRVFTIERHRELLRQARQRFEYLRLYNVTTRFGDGTRGWVESAPFDRILVTAAAAEMPVQLMDLLAIGGLMVAPVGRERRDQELLRVRRTGTEFVTEKLGMVRFVPLVPGLPRATPPQYDLPLQ
ncbi:MAG TPA: protein-L-isoaspartate(D-aspartate) O-methyltransferase [Stellaceae bacterium]|jgi:protein-L-isoaspartate(D-aspartate) O-methyltransferase|nr:protein-L-isoaspartate(D-aspartate) O-methyltransferase [Stellaceae bacterium]